ncbi:MULTISPECIES: hypothetical protein [unclassified Pantoea]|uniref:hypothetical protein n=1 Tax=unclassified Pantoea TaxID=2630326 RepID=UPI00226986A1|nr:MULTISPECIES: hypothetical protein [unclassified Pantoea]
MSEFKGTPGPWASKDVHICQQDKAGLQIGFLMTSSDERRKEGAANAHLIAAAPELLEALQLLMSEQSGGDKSCGHNGSTCTCPYDKAKAAISKAFGQ